MFLDLKSSTTIAERLGDRLFFELLKDFFSDITDPIISVEGEVYQYVGDEVVITWPLDKGLVKNNCITCFFRIEEIIKSRQIYYEEKYGFIPGFRAGLHLGQATVGEIGVIKKDIVYSGDVLNTTSRIQNECRVHDVNLLVSSAVLQQLPASEKYKSEPIGEIQLRGKIDTVMLNAVNTTIY
jgi:adenylate cyclase